MIRMSNPPETIQNEKSSLENIDLKNLKKSVIKECERLNIDLFYKEENGKAIYNMQSVNTYLKQLLQKDIVSYGVPVVALQIFFESKGIDIGKIDGINGPQFRAWIREYQKQHGFAETGRINQETWTHIQNEINEPIITQENKNHQKEASDNPQWDYQLTGIRIRKDGNDDDVQGIKDICKWYGTTQGNCLIQWDIGKSEQTWWSDTNLLTTIQITDIQYNNDNYQISFIEKNKNEQTQLLSELSPNIKGFDIWSKNIQPPEELQGFMLYDHKQPFFYTDDLS